MVNVLNVGAMSSKSFTRFYFIFFVYVTCFRCNHGLFSAAVRRFNGYAGQFYDLVLDVGESFFPFDRAISEVIVVSRVTSGLSQGENFAEGGPVSTVGGSRSNIQQKLRNKLDLDVDVYTKTRNHGNIL